MDCNTQYHLHLLAEANQETLWEDAWCRTYGVGIYAAIPESHRIWLRQVNPHFRG